MDNSYNVLLNEEASKKIDLRSALERSFWCGQFNCSLKDLIIAVDKVGPEILEVMNYFNKK